MMRWKRYLAAGVVLMTTTSMAAKPRPVEVHGHRGARAVRPENTMAGFRHAIAAGVDAIELDVVVTADDRLVVHHDLKTRPDLCLGPGGAPLAASVPIRSMTLEAVRALDCGSRTDPAFPRQQAVPGERVPTLEEAFALLAATPGLKLDVEVKSYADQPDLSPPPDRLADLVLAAVAAAGVRDRVELRSFDHRVLRAVRARDAGILLAALVPKCPSDAGATCGEDLVQVTRAAGATRLAPHLSRVDAALVRRLHDAGMTVIAWTANDEADWRRLVESGVDGIVTDDPAAARKW
jgi:glycerophosphoryl diester phosphodiesterase